MSVCFDRVKPLVDETVRRLATEAFAGLIVNGGNVARADAQFKMRRSIAATSSPGAAGLRTCSAPLQAPSTPWNPL